MPRRPDSAEDLRHLRFLTDPISARDLYPKLSNKVFRGKNAIATEDMNA